MSTVNRNFPLVNRKFSTGSRNFPTVNRKFSTASRKFPTGSTKNPAADMGMKGKAGSSQNHIDDKGYWDSGCSRHMTGNISYLSDYEPFDRGYVSFGQGGYKITEKGTIKTGKLEFENVYIVKDLKYNLFNDDNVLLRTPRQHNMYSIDLNNIVPHRDLTCLVAKASVDECMIWHRRLVITDVFSRFTWTFFLKTKDETSGILRKFITKIENLKDLKVKIIRCDNGGEFRNKELDDFGSQKRIKREFSNARTPQQNGVAERRNRCDNGGEFRNKELNDFCSQKGIKREFSNVRTSQQNGVAERRNRILVNKAYNETPYELFNGRTHPIGFLKPFRCHVMILNTLDNLSKFKAKGDEGYFLGYSMSSKAFRVYEEHLESTSSQPQDACNTDAPESSGNSNPTATSTNPSADQLETLTVETPIPTVSSPVPTVCFTDSQEPSSETRLISKRVTNQEETPYLDNILTLSNQFEDILGVTTNLEESNGVEADVSNMETTITASPTPTLRIHRDHPKKESNGVEADVSNIETTITASPTPTLRIHRDHPKSQIIGPMDTPIQTRNKSKEVGEHSFIATIHQKTDPALLQFCLFSFFLSQLKPKKIFDALQDPSWNKKDERGIIIGNKAKLVAQGHTPEEGIDYDDMDVKSAFLYGTIDEEVYVMQPPGFQDPEFPARVSASTPMDKDNPWGKDGTGKDVDLHLYRSMIGSLMYLTASRPDIMFTICACARHQVTPKECHLHAVKRIFRYLKGHPKLGLWYPKESPFNLVAYSNSDYGGATQDCKSTTGGCQLLGRILISWQCKKQTIMATSTTEAEYVAAASGCFTVYQMDVKSAFLYGTIDEEVYVMQPPRFQDPKYLARVYKVEKAIEFEALMREKFQMSAMDSDYGGATQDRKSTSEGCQFLGRRLISWQCKKQTIMVTSTTKAEYVAAASCCGQVLWIQNQLLDYGLSMSYETLSKEISTPILRLYALTFKPTIYISHIRQFWSTARIETTTEGTQNLATMDGVLRTVIESSLRRNLKLQDEEGISSLPDTEIFENLTLMGYNISPNQKFTFQKDQDRATIAKSSTLPHDSAPRVTSPAAEEGSMQQAINELTALCTSLQRQHSELLVQFQAQEVEINRLKERVKILEDKEGVIGARSSDDAPIKGRRIDEEEVAAKRLSSDTEEVRLDEGEVAPERTSEDTEEMATVLTTMDAATVLASGAAEVPTASGSIPTAGAEVSTGSDVIPTASPIFATATVVTPYRMRKGKEVMVESETPKKQKVQEQIDAQVAKELEEQLAREDQKRAEQIARDAEIARIHAEEELQSMIESLDRNNETVAKYLEEYRQFSLELPMERRIELISDLVKYQDNYTKAKDFKGMTFEEVEAKLNSVCKQMEDFIPIGSKEEAERTNRKGINLEQESAKKQKSSEEITEEAKSPEEVTEEKIKEMMQLVPIE
nr:ribonuclease H-like domain-containing protein [Tanacetum cinerariifolium]